MSEPSSNDFNQAIGQAAQNQQEESRRLSLQAEKDRIARDSEIHSWRRDYAVRVYKVIIAWLISDVVLVLLYGFGEQYKFFLPDKSVIIAFITSSTVTVIGLFAIVMRWLFPSADKSKEG